MRAFVDLTGKRFGRLQVMCLGPKDNSNINNRWWCECECQEKSVLVCVGSLNGGKSRSCGCLSRDLARGRAIARRGEKRTHGDFRSAEYRVWGKIKQRCLNPNHKEFKNYGGRGIKIGDPRWMKYENFLSDILATIGRKPAPHLTIDRIDNDGPYTKENIRWNDSRGQARNKRTTKLTVDKVVEIRRLSVSTSKAELAKKFGVSETGVRAVIGGEHWLGPAPLDHLYFRAVATPKVPGKGLF